MLWIGSFWLLPSLEMCQLIVVGLSGAILWGIWKSGNTLREYLQGQVKAWKTQEAASPIAATLVANNAEMPRQLSADEIELVNLMNAHKSELLDKDLTWQLMDYVAEKNRTDPDSLPPMGIQAADFLLQNWTELRGRTYPSREALLDHLQALDCPEDLVIVVATLCRFLLKFKEGYVHPSRPQPSPNVDNFIAGLTGWEPYQYAFAGTFLLLLFFVWLYSPARLRVQHALGVATGGARRLFLNVLEATLKLLKSAAGCAHAFLLRRQEGVTKVKARRAEASKGPK